MRQLRIVKQITNRETQSLEKYFQEIGKIGLVTADMEVILAKRIKTGDPVALEKLVKANLRFVVSVAKQYQHNGITLGDLINEGNVGLVKAAERFDETRGFKFISYAVWWIRQSILQALAEQVRVVRLPLNRIGSLNQLNRSFAALEQKFQREPSVEELADSMEVSTESVEMTMRNAGRHVSVDSASAYTEETLLDSLQSANADPDADLLSDSLKHDITLALQGLSKREANVISEYFGLDGNHPMTLEEIGDRMGLTRERVRQIKEKATSTLRSNPENRTLLAYF